MIDFHCHLDLFENPTAVIDEVDRRGFYTLMVTTTPSAWAGSFALIKDKARISAALGLHPQLAHLRSHELDLFESLLGQTRYVGEIGLDGGKGFKPHWKAQEDVFASVLKHCANSGGKILSIHSRAASGAVVSELALHPSAGIPVLHWFTGSVSDLKKAIAQGCWFSVGPAMLNSKKGRDLAALIPKNRLLPETDAPFAKQNGKALNPWDCDLVVFELITIWEMPEKDVRHQLLDNLRSITNSP